VNRPKISIIVPARNEERYIGTCLESIIACDYPKESLEIMVVDGMSSDRTAEIVRNYAQQYPFVKLLENPDKTAPHAMNIGIRKAEGESVFIISAHAHYPEDYFSGLVRALQSLQADVVGGVLRTEVKNRNKKSNAIKRVLNDRLGVGGSLFRIGAQEVTEVDTVAFGCYRKEAFEKFGLFDERLTRNQDIELNKRIKNGGGKIYLVPQVTCTYFARETFTELAKNNFSNGMWNILTAYYTKSFSSLSLRHYIPLLFLLSLLLPPLLSIGIPRTWLVSAASLSAYLLAILSRSVMLKDASNSVSHLAAAFAVLHLSYGLGSLIGIIRVLNRCAKDKNECIGH
jgi:glycosyltransferase involved in cell wall biosynthesis